MTRAIGAGRRVLVVSPRFHGYWRSIEEAFARRGHLVRTHRYDDFGGVRGKARIKLHFELGERLGRGGHDAMRDHVTAGALRALDETAPDLLLVVKGDLLDTAFWEHVATARLPSVLWLYDELRRMAHTPESLAAVGAIASYSGHDAETLGAAGYRSAHVPLAHDPHVPVEPRRSDEVVLVGARYPGRERLLQRMWEAGVPVRAHGRDWSGHVVDRARTWRVGAPAVPSGRDLPRPTAYGVMAGARAALNVHGDQDGFTMRTFEAAGVGGLELVDRDDVHHLYEPGREVLVFGSADEAIDLAQRAAWEPRWATAIREAGRRRTLAEHTFEHRAAALEALWH